MDPIANMLTSIRNANAALLPEIDSPYSKLKEGVAKILVKEGYIREYRVRGKVKKVISIVLKYQGKQGVIVGIKRISRPGLRRFVGSREVPRVLGGMGISILSTSRGIVSGEDARRRNIGGELLCQVW